MKCPKCGKEMHLDELNDGVWFVCDYCLIKKSPYTVYDDVDDDGRSITAVSVPKKSNHSIYSIPLLISMFIGIAYILYSAAYWSSLNSAPDAFSQIGSGIATMLVLPHLVFAAIAVLFNVLGFCLKNRWLALTSAILYTVSLVLFPMYFMFVVAEVVLSFVAFATMCNRKISNPKLHSRILIACTVCGLILISFVLYGSFSGKSLTPDNLSNSSRDFPEGDYSDTGSGNMFLSTPSGTSENGNVPFVFVEKDTLMLQIGLDARGFDGSKISFIYIDGILVEKYQLADTQTSLDLSDNFLSPGSHLVQVVQYNNDDPESEIITYKSASYEVKEE